MKKYIFNYYNLISFLMMNKKLLIYYKKLLKMNILLKNNKHINYLSITILKKMIMKKLKK